MIAARRGGIIFPKRARKISHLRKEALDILGELFVFTVQIQKLQTQIVADEGVGWMHLREFIVGLTHRAELISELSPQFGMRLWRYGIEVESVVLASLGDIIGKLQFACALVADGVVDEELTVV